MDCFILRSVPGAEWRLLMQKTKIGLSVGVMGAVVYFSALLGGYIPLFLIAGYVFLKEENIWLRKAAFKAIALMLVFSALSTVISTINEFLGIFNGLFDWQLEIPLELDYVLGNVISIAKTILFALLGFKAFGQGDIPISSIDSAIKNDNE